MTHHAHKDRIVNGAFYFGPRPTEDITTQVNALIDAALEDDVAQQPPRAYLGGSRLGVECLRALGYEWAKQKADSAALAAAVAAGQGPAFRVKHPFSGRTIRRFRMGHWHEDETAAWLRMAGFDLLTHQPNGKQFGFGVAPDPETGEKRLAGHIDGVLMSGPAPLPYPALWEHKIMKAKKWTECVKRGVQVANPVYFHQMQTYMAFLELQNAVFMAVNTDTGELHVEIIAFDRAAAQWAYDRGVEVLKANDPLELPRVGRDESDYRCKWCDYRDQCWSQPVTPAVAMPRPAWLDGPKA